MDFLRCYLRSRMGVLLLPALFVLVFAVSFWLSRLSLRAVAYPALICGVFALVALALDFSKERKKHLALTRLRDVPAAELTALPEPSGAAEADLQELIASLRREIAGVRDQNAESFRDMVDYYTVWAHQIKTPITSMHLTLEREDTPETRKLTGDLRQIQRYVDMVMAYLRLGSEQSDYVFRECELDAILRECAAEYASEFIDRGLALDLHETGKRVVTDEKWLSFLLGQVLSNALKYTRKGGISIYMEPSGTLCVQDTGIGIDEADLPRVFEKGYTGLNGRRDARASGLGLYLVKRVAGSLGIGVSIESKPGEGTCVKLDLRQYELRAE